jgi:hypothetical protein
MDFNDIFDAAKGVYEESGSLKNVTFNKIANYMGCELVGSFGRAISRHYKSEVERINEKYDVKIPPIALLRADVGNQDIEDHPLLKARGVYGGFKIGMFDWVKFVTLPLEIGVKESELLGIICSDARKQDMKSFNQLYLAGRQNDFEFYEEVVGPRVKEVFNLPGEVTELKYKNRKELKYKNKVYTPPSETIEPCVRIGSKALSTWLYEDVGYPSLEDVLKFVSSDRNKLAFIEGYIAGKGIPGHTSTSLKIELYHKRKKEAIVIRKTLKKLGIKVREPRKRTNKGGIHSDLFPDKYTQYFIGIYTRQLKELNILNPRHRRILSANRTI